MRSRCIKEWRVYHIISCIVWAGAERVEIVSCCSQQQHLSLQNIIDLKSIYVIAMFVSYRYIKLIIYILLTRHC